jgi:hypothetical protein
MNVHPGVAQILSVVPKRPMGRSHPAQEEAYQQWLRDWANGILRLGVRIDFKVSSRGWCYLLEEYGLPKGDFDTAEQKINECRKAGYLPLGICAEDVRRLARGIEDIDDDDFRDYAEKMFKGIDACHEIYIPFSFWDDKEFYLEIVVEKIDLVNLFDPICRKFRIPIKNNVGWNDINSRVRTMKRFAMHAAAGRKPVLQYYGDFDPAGLLISTALRNNMKELEGAVNFELAQDGIPDLNIDNVIVERCGLNYDFINDNHLSWIDGLATGSGKRLDDINHRDHQKPYSPRLSEKLLSRLGRALDALHCRNRRPQMRGERACRPAEESAKAVSPKHSSISAPQRPCPLSERARGAA